MPASSTPLPVFCLKCRCFRPIIKQFACHHGDSDAEFWCAPQLSACGSGYSRAWEGFPEKQEAHHVPHVPFSTDVCFRRIDDRLLGRPGVGFTAVARRKWIWSGARYRNGIGDAVRFAALALARGIRLEILSAEGGSLYDSGFCPGNLLEWRMVDQQGSIPQDGLYGCLVTVEDVHGRRT